MEMGKRSKWLLGTGTLALLVAGSLAYWYVQSRQRGPIPELLDFMPPEASTVLYIDVAALRASPFLEELRALAPSPGADRDYADFVRQTGFDYTRDLDRAVVTLVAGGKESNVFAAAEGRFNREKIARFALKGGKRQALGRGEAFSTPLGGGSKQVTFMFLGNNRIALTDGPNLVRHLTPRPRGLADPAVAPWRERFLRLAGSPVFAVSALNMESGSAASSAAGGFRSDQLRALAASLRWATLAARPDGDRLRVVAEGECASEESARQLSGMVNGLIMLARAGLSDPKAQRQVGPEAVVAIEEGLRGIEVSRIDRGETKAVRVMIDLTPRLLQAMRQMNAQPTAK